MIEPFVEACYEATQRCFRGTILSYRRTTDRQLEQSWEYELWFGAGFATIERGHVHAFNGARERMRALAPPGGEGEIVPLSLVADGNGRPLLRD